MTTVITDDCVACGACEDECPTGAISLGAGIFVVDPGRCTGCVGSHESRTCADICPVDCCVPDPDEEESRRLLLHSERLGDG